MFICIYILTDVHIDFSLYMNYSLRTQRLQNKISQFHKRQSSMQSNALTLKDECRRQAYLKTRVKLLCDFDTGRNILPLFYK